MGGGLPMAQEKQHPAGENGNGSKAADVVATPAFKLEHSLGGVASGFMDVAERVVDGTLGRNEAREATRALCGVSQVVKVQIEAIKLFDKGSERAREEAAKILGIS